MALWNIPVRWECGGAVNVEAPTLEKAIELAQYAPFPDEDWSDDSVYVDDEASEYIRKYDNDNQPDEKITSANEIYSLHEKVQVIATGEIAMVCGYRVESDGTVIYGCKIISDGSNEERFHVREYKKKELRRAQCEPSREASNVAEFLNEN